MLVVNNVFTYTINLAKIYRPFVYYFSRIVPWTTCLRTMNQHGGYAEKQFGCISKILTTYLMLRIC